jgi:3-hydroxybutyryl-CoA dehydrogenase
MVKTFNQVAVIGAGTMGHGLALLFALGGSRVCLVDVSRERLNRAMDLIRSHLKGLDLQRQYDIGADEVLALITTEPALGERVAQSDIVVEAIVEKAEAKKELYHALGPLVGPETIVASTTSYMNVFALAPDQLQTRLLIAHFYNPPYLIPLVEIVPGPKTDTAVLGRVKNSLESLQMVCVTMKKYMPGFIVNRLQRALGREIFHLIDEGVAEPAEIDRAVKASLAIRLPVMGVVARYDFAGLDATLNNLKGEPIHLASGEDRSLAIERLVEQGHYGVKTGRGFFDWSGRDLAELLRERDLRLLQVRRLMKGWE